MDLVRIAHSIISGRHVPGKWLRVFDFDKTLATTSGLPWAVNPKTGDAYRLESLEPYEKVKPGFELDWREFNTYLKEPVTPKIKYIEIMKNILDGGTGDVIVLTARNNADPIKRFLAKFECYPEVYALGSENPQNKAYVINELMLENNYRNVQFWDDNRKNVKAVEALKSLWGDRANITSTLVSD